MKLHANTLSKRYGGGAPVLDLPEAVFGSHRVEGIIGPNGAGKSTLMGCLTRRIAPTTGTVRLEADDGTTHDLMPLKSHEVARLGLVKTNQRIQGIDSLTIRDQLRMAATPPEHETWRSVWQPPRVDDAIETEIDGLLERFRFENANGYANSGGEKKLLDILRCVIVKPRLLLMDEPTAGLPDEITQDVMAMVRDLTESGDVSVVIIEHDLDLIWNNCDYVHFLSEGQVLFEGTPEDVKANKVVAEKYMGVRAC